MAVYINGIKVAGRGISGKSPYQVAVENGYSGSEKDFNSQLLAIGEAAKGFQELQEQVNNVKNEIDTSVNNAITNINTTVNNAKIEIDNKISEALSQIPNSENLVTKSLLASTLEDYTTKTYVDNALASLVTDIFVAGATAPTNTKLLWIDTTASTGGLKYYNGSAWTHVPVAWS